MIGDLVNLNPLPSFKKEESNSNFYDSIGLMLEYIKKCKAKNNFNLDYFEDGLKNTLKLGYDLKLKDDHGFQ